jgi:CubicO group peptidase (beta-lactamase class C family)
MVTIVKSFSFLTLFILLSACMMSDNPFMPFDTLEPVNINDGWTISTPAAENINTTALNQIYQDLHSNRELWQMRSLLVFRNDSLVAESYLKDDNDRTNPRAIWSCTKQILSLLTGIAIDSGLLSSVNDPLSAYLSTELTGHSDKSSITIEDLLTMRSGIGFDETNDASNLIQKKPADTIDYILNLPMIKSPGQRFHYNSGDPHLIAASIQNEAGIPLEDWADANLFTDLEFNNYDWIKYDEYNYGGWGISTTPRELAKIAHLVLNNGNWKGQQLVPLAWINSVKLPQVPDLSGSDMEFSYLWSIYHSSTVDYFLMAGSGGQFAVVIPDKNMVIVTMSEHDTDGDLELDIYDFLDIVKSIVDISF